MGEKKIVECHIDKGRYQNFVWVKYDDGSVSECIGVYYCDELYFSEDEFVGLTRQEARDLMKRKDIAYLRS